jgi:hypothetical protein
LIQFYRKANSNSRRRKGREYTVLGVHCAPG